MYNILNSTTDSFVSIANSEGSYSCDPPFNPKEEYPEYPFGEKNISSDNHVYNAVRESLHQLGLDRDNYGSSIWNPLQGIVQPGNKVFVKPNAVMDKNLSGDSLYAVITHPSVVRAVLDYVIIALKGKGEIILGDAPQYNSNFKEYLRNTNLTEVVAFLNEIQELNIQLLDLRRIVAHESIDRGYISIKDLEILNGDPLGYTIVNLEEKSALDLLSNLSRIYGADYDREHVVSNHSKGKHNYCIANSVLTSDAIIHVPKMKVHRKVGVTLNIKGLVGINGDKNYLAHYRLGSPSKGGDEYPDEVHPFRKLSRTAMSTAKGRLLGPRKLFLEPLYSVVNRTRLLLGKIARATGILRNMQVSDQIAHGDWVGNDTAWRMAVDLLRIALCADVKGRIHSIPVRRYFSVIDGIIAGEGEGPLYPSSRNTRIIISGRNPVSVDYTCAYIMGYNPSQIPIINFFIDNNTIDWTGFGGGSNIRICLDNGNMVDLDNVMPLDPAIMLPKGWSQTFLQINKRY